MSDAMWRKIELLVRLHSSTRHKAMIMQREPAQVANLKIRKIYDLHADHGGGCTVYPCWRHAW